MNKWPSQFMQMNNKDENTYLLKAVEKAGSDQLPSQLSRLEPAINHQWIPYMTQLAVLREDAPSLPTQIQKQLMTK